MYMYMYVYVGNNVVFESKNYGISTSPQRNRTGVGGMSSYIDHDQNRLLSPVIKIASDYRYVGIKKSVFCRVNTVVPKVSPTHNNVIYLSYVVVICKVTAVGVKSKKINATVGLGRRRKKNTCIKD